MASITALEVHSGGQGKNGNKKPVLFPKLVFLFDENLHGDGKPLEDVYNAAIDCSSKTMYPDWLSLTGDSYVAEAYKKYGVVISPRVAEPSSLFGLKEVEWNLLTKTISRL